jgi:3-phosphoshikimate 1-carboxyvinyltransferase
MITGGTVLVTDWPDDASTSATLFLDVAAEMGAYVVKSRDGLSVTTRSTSGVLQGAHISGHAGSLLPLLLVLAAAASTPSTFVGTEANADVLALLRDAGARIEVGSSTTVMPSTLRGIRWTSTDPVGVMAGLVLSLVVDEMTVSVAQLNSSILHEWNRVLAADEYLLPGSGLLPHEYVNGAPSVRRTKGR